MAATQYKYNTPGNEFCVIDQGSAPAYPTLNSGAHEGYDNIPGENPLPAATQGTNPYFNGSVLVDTTNDYVYQGDPMMQRTVTAAITVLNTVSGQRLILKNPA